MKTKPPSQFFRVLPPKSDVTESPPNRAYLVRDNWNDWFQFQTQFWLVVFDGNGERHEPGLVKIGQYGMPRGEPSPKLEDSFNSLSAQFFSLGQDENYYETLNALSPALKERILRGLRDVAFDIPRFDRAIKESVTERSLLRDISVETVRGRFHRLAIGDSSLSRYAFSYELPSLGGGLERRTSLHFSVTPDSVPPTNVHVIIGRNGVGKTTCLNGMAESLTTSDSTTPHGHFDYGSDSSPGDGFTGVVSVSFSAFDPFAPIVRHGTPARRLRHNYVGLKRLGKDSGPFDERPKTPAELGAEFVDSARLCAAGPRSYRWDRALETLEADPLFAETGIRLLVRVPKDVAWAKRASTLFESLSSGHKIVLLTLTKLVELVDERTLVLIDEPEAHLHPPLLAAFVRALSTLLTARNGVAVLATHSPVVLQEVPKSCAWLLRRNGAIVLADRPSIETFGENVGILTREAFGLEVTKSGYHRLIAHEVLTHSTYPEMLRRFQEQLGAEARSVILGLLAPTATPFEDGQ